MKIKLKLLLKTLKNFLIATESLDYLLLAISSWNLLCDFFRFLIELWTLAQYREKVRCANTFFDPLCTRYFPQGGQAFVPGLWGVTTPRTRVDLTQVEDLNRKQIRLRRVGPVRSWSLVSRGLTHEGVWPSLSTESVALSGVSSLKCLFEGLEFLFGEWAAGL